MGMVILTHLRGAVVNIPRGIRGYLILYGRQGVVNHARKESGRRTVIFYARSDGFICLRVYGRYGRAIGTS